MKFQNEILGGILIGLSSAIPLIFEGRIAGASGYASSALRPNTEEGRTSVFLIIGLVAGGLIWRLQGGFLPIAADSNLSMLTWAFAGLLVGFGARLGGGCTSGHGVCGLGRASKRSLASVITFMVMAILTCVLMRKFL